MFTIGNVQVLWRTRLPRSVLRAAITPSPQRFLRSRIESDSDSGAVIYDQRQPFLAGVLEHAVDEHFLVGTAGECEGNLLGFGHG